MNVDKDMNVLDQNAMVKFRVAEHVPYSRHESFCLYLRSHYPINEISFMETYFSYFGDLRKFNPIHR